MATWNSDFGLVSVGTLLQLKALKPLMQLSDPSAEAKTATHPAVICQISPCKLFAVICTLTSTVCSELEARTADGLVWPVKHASHWDNEYLRKAQQITLESRRDVNRDTETDESEDESITKHLEWRPSSTTIKAGYLQLYRMYVVRRDEVVVFKEKGFHYRFERASVSALQTRLCHGVIGELYNRCLDLQENMGLGAIFDDEMYRDLYEQKLRVPLRRSNNNNIRRARGLTISVPEIGATFTMNSPRRLPPTPYSDKWSKTPETSGMANVTDNWRQRRVSAAPSPMAEAAPAPWDRARVNTRARAGSLEGPRPGRPTAVNGKWQNVVGRARSGSLKGAGPTKFHRTEWQAQQNNGRAQAWNSRLPSRPSTSHGEQQFDAQRTSPGKISRVVAAQDSNARAAIQNAYALLNADDEDSESESDVPSSDGSQVWSVEEQESESSSLTSASSGESDDKLTAHASKVLSQAPTVLTNNMRCAAHQRQCNCFWHIEADKDMAQLVVAKMAEISLTSED